MQRKKHQISYLNNKIFQLEINICTNIKKPCVDLSSDTNIDDLSKNVCENFIVILRMMIDEDNLMLNPPPPSPPSHKKKKKKKVVLI